MAVIHIIVAITNQGRSVQTIRGIEIAAVGLGAKQTSAINEYGDLPGELIRSYASRQPKRIDAGETDLAYAEIPVPCSFSLVRIIVKVPQPPHTLDTPLGERRVYQRKLLVQLSEVCPK